LVQHAGLYVVSAEVAPELPPPPLPPPTVATNELIASASASLQAGETNFFNFHAVAGRTYTFRTVLGTLDDSVMGLFDPQKQAVISFNDDTNNPESEDDRVQLASELSWTADRTGDVYVLVYGFDEESTGSYRLAVYSTSAALREETLALLSVLPPRANEMAAAVDDALYQYDAGESSDDGDAWDDSEDGWDDSSDWLDSDVWDEEEEF
jgi:hypothetical protein